MIHTHELGDDEARVQLRDRLYETIQAGAERVEQQPWSHAPAGGGPSKPAGDSLVLMEHLMTMQEEAKTLAIACHFPHTTAGLALSGSRETCIPPLDWFRPLSEAYSPTLIDQDRLLGMLKIGARVHPDVSEYDMAFHLMKQLPSYDWSLAYCCVGKPFVRACDLEVGKIAMRIGMASTQDEFKQTMDSWKDKGLLYVLAMGAEYMGDLVCWMPPEHHTENSAGGLATVLGRLKQARSQVEVQNALEDFVASQDSREQSCMYGARMLDRLAILMGVKSNAGASKDHDLCVSLSRFPRFDQKPAVHIWQGIKPALESCMPPSMLLATTGNSWGVYPLEYELLPDYRLRFRPTPITWVSSKPPTLKLLVSDPANSISASVQRLGKAALSKEMIHAMLSRPQNARYALAVGMHDLGSTPAMIARASNTLKSCTDVVPWSRRVQFRYPLHMLAWRIDTPSRIIAFTGTGMDVGSFMTGELAPHTLSKTLLEERSQRQDPSCVHLTEFPVVASVRRSLRSWAAKNLGEGFREKVKQDEDGMQAHTLEEAIACFVTKSNKNHSELKLDESKRWDKGEIDSRYSETQTGFNGFRFRDWVCVYADQKDVEKCRLESHVMTFEEAHDSRLPWRCGKRLDWVNVRSSLQAGPMILRDSGTFEDENERWKAFVRTIKVSFMHGLRQLPTKTADHHVERANTTVYTDQNSRKVVVIYAPTGADRFEFISFGLN